MNLADIYAQMEEELAWRQEEIRTLRNQLSVAEEARLAVFRKALVVMLYSHFEGFCKVAFGIYIKAINGEGLKRSQLNDHLLAASMSAVFSAYDNCDAKCRIFKNALPDDAKLHKFARQVDFLRAVGSFLAETAFVPEDVADVEDNLKPVVLRKILFRLGFQHDLFADREGDINLLLMKRNAVAHGMHRPGLTEGEYRAVEEAAFFVMNELKRCLLRSLDSKSYLR